MLSLLYVEKITLILNESSTRNLIEVHRVMLETKHFRGMGGALSRDLNVHISSDDGSRVMR